MRPTSGLTFGGRYQLSSRVAIGGMGEVWQATDLVIGRTVAIKILKDEFLGDPGFLERFRAEARHAALVNHEGIANVFDYGEEDGSAYLVMELVPGEALSTILERERVLATDRVLDIVAQTASALHAAHSAGLVHRDIKPGNLLITPDGRVKITDFGIARIADQVPLTATGQVMGTVQYLSPEQASGQSASPTTDVYSLGIVAYEALAGRRPFTGESQVAIAMAQINEQPPDLPVSVSEPVRNLVYASIAKKPSDRPPSAAHFARAAQALRRGDVAGAAASVPAVAGGPITAATLLAPAISAPSTQATQLMTAAPTSGGQVPPPTTPIETSRRSPWTWPLVALIVVLLIIVIGGIIFLATSSNTPQPEPSATTSPSMTPSPTPTPTPTPTEDDSVDLGDGSALLGLNQADATAYLTERELDASFVDGNAAPSSEQVGTVYQVSPRGTVAKGTTITLTVYSEIPAPTKPNALAATTAPPYLGGTEVEISIPEYTGCSAPTSLTAVRVSVTGGTVDLPNPAPGTTRDFTLTLPGAETDSGTATLNYLVECSGIASPVSDTLTIDYGP